MSLKIGRFFGINLYLHWTFWLLPLWIILTPSRGLPLPLELGVLAFMFGCVVLHEYGHALTARLFGIATRDVTLYPIGGVARLERMSEKPLEEFAIAIAGPLVNLAIAALLLIGTAAVSVLAPALLTGAPAEVIWLLVVLNLMLFAFNLLPAFPMDGGRIFRALLSIPLGRLPATRAAVFVSIAMAVLFGFIGVLILHNVMLVLIGVFVIWAGQQELVALEMRERQRQEGHLDEAPEVEPQAPPSWHPTPNRPVTVYVWDARTHQWIFQGIVPQT